MEDSNDVKIKSNNLLNITECIICSENFNKCNITKCGHSFCEKCIQNCININNCCPTCKTPLKKEETYKNYLVDDIIKYVQTERSKEEYNNIEHAYMNNSSSNMSLKMNRIQIIFFDNLKEIFNTYNSFYEKIEEEQKKKIHDINNGIDEIRRLGNSEKLDQIEAQKKELSNQHSNLVKDLENSLDKFMKNLPESPLLLPIKTKIFIERRNATIDHLAFNPTDTTDKLYEIVKKYFVSLGDEIEFGDSMFYIARKDFELDINSEMSIQNKETIIEKAQKFLSTGLVTGEVIVFRGNFTLKSEAPRACLTYEFEKNNHLNTKTNYFSCDSCRLNCNFF